MSKLSKKYAVTSAPPSPPPPPPTHDYWNSLLAARVERRRVAERYQENRRETVPTKVHTTSVAITVPGIESGPPDL
jgi:hypothetical protein